MRHLAIEANASSVSRSDSRKLVNVAIHHVDVCAVSIVPLSLCGPACVRERGECRVPVSAGSDLLVRILQQPPNEGAVVI